MILSVLLIGSFALAACAPAATQPPPAPTEAPAAQPAATEVMAEPTATEAMAEPTAVEPTEAPQPGPAAWPDIPKSIRSKAGSGF